MGALVVKTSDGSHVDVLPDSEHIAGCDSREAYLVDRSSARRLFSRGACLRCTFVAGRGLSECPDLIWFAVGVFYVSRASWYFIVFAAIAVVDAPRFFVQKP